MSLIKKFKEWITDSDEKEEFFKYWKSENRCQFESLTNYSVDYHLKLIWIIKKLEERIENLEKK